MIRENEGVWGNESVWAAALYYFVFAGYFQIPGVLGGALER